MYIIRRIEYMYLCEVKSWIQWPDSSDQFHIYSVFTVNVVLVASQWQHHMWTIPLYPPINAEHEAGEDRSTVYQVLL